MKSICRLAVLVFVVIACSTEKDELKSIQNPKGIKLLETPQFNVDSAFFFIEEQLSFGPRIPNSKAHQECGLYLAKKLEMYGASMHIQEFEEEAYDGTLLKGKNIIASFNESAKKRILLSAHWDTRHVADKDPLFNGITNEVQLLGANDGASGVAVLLEIARGIALNDSISQNIGIDIILFDLEDYGSPETGEGYCLGSQY